MEKLNVAILGATGAVGQELAQILTERAFPMASLRLLASPRSAGKRFVYGDREYVVEAVTEQSFRGVDVAFFSAGGDISKQWAPVAVNAGAVVIDNTSAFRMADHVPLVVPEVNGQAIAGHRGIIANPNCSTIILAVVLKPIYDAVGIERVVVSTYQAVSGAGYKAMDELEHQVQAYTQGKTGEACVLPVSSGARHYPVFLNAIPQIDVFQEDAYTREEWKMVRETKKIFADDSLRITSTTVRLPIMRSHCESVNVQTKQDLTPEGCRALLSEAPGVAVLDNVDAQEYPMPLFTSGSDPVWVGRIRADRTVPHGLNLWLVGDQIRKGAALNGVQIAEDLLSALR